MKVDKYVALVSKINKLYEKLTKDYEHCMENKVTAEDLIVAMEIVKLNGIWSSIALILAKHDVPDYIYDAALKLLDEEISLERMDFRAPEALMKMIEREVNG